MMLSCLSYFFPCRKYVVLEYMDYFGRTRLVFHRKKRRVLIMKHATLTECFVYNRFSTMPFIVEHFVEDNHLFVAFTEKSHTLRQWIGMGQSEGDRIHVLRQVLDAYRYLHGHGVYHVDIKPENILIYPDKVVKIIDFDHSLCLSTDRRDFDPGWTLPYFDVSVDITSKDFKNKTDWEKWDLYLLGLLIIFIVMERDFDLGDCEYITRCPIYDRHEEFMHDIHFVQEILHCYDIPIRLSHLLHHNPERRPPLTSS